MEYVMVHFESDSGPETSWEELLSEANQYAKRLAGNSTFNGQGAEDFASSAMINFLTKNAIVNSGTTESDRRTCSIKTFTYRRMCDQLRKYYTAKVHICLQFERADRQIVPCENSLEIEKNEAKEKLYQAIARLDCDERELVMERYFGDLSTREIAQRHRKSQRDVQDRLKKIYTKLRKILVDR